MKNRYIDALKARAKHYHRRCHGTFINGIISYHLYDHIKANDLTYWDDVVFIVNDYRVRLNWTHPRYEYEQLVADEAWRRLEALYPKDDPFAKTTPSYKRVGKSRKKITAWTSQIGESNQERYDKLSSLILEIGESISFEVRPSLKITWDSTAKGMDLCLPFEVRSLNNLKELSEVARRLVTRRTTLKQECGNYRYTQNDWLREHNIATGSPNAHRVAT